MRCVLVVCSLLLGARGDSGRRGDDDDERERCCSPQVNVSCNCNSSGGEEGCDVGEVSSFCKEVFEDESASWDETRGECLCGGQLLNGGVHPCECRGEPAIPPCDAMFPEANASWDTATEQCECDVTVINGGREPCVCAGTVSVLDDYCEEIFACTGASPAWDVSFGECFCVSTGGGRAPCAFDCGIYPACCEF